jgi:hypothetical protein
MGGLALVALLAIVIGVLIGERAALIKEEQL